MNMRTWMFLTVVLGLSGCKPVETGDDSGPTPPFENASCADYSGIAGWQVVSADPIAVVGHGAMVDSQGREVISTPAFVADAQKFYLKTLYMQAKDVQRAEFQKKRQRLCGPKSITPEEKTVVNAALISWLIVAVNSDDSVRLATNNAALINGIIVSPAVRERLQAEGQNL